MARANSLKKAVQSVIDLTEKGNTATINQTDRRKETLRALVETFLNVTLSFYESTTLL